MTENITYTHTRVIINEIGPRGDAHPLAPPGSATDLVFVFSVATIAISLYESTPPPRSHPQAISFDYNFMGLLGGKLA